VRIEEWLRSYFNTALAGVVELIWSCTADTEGDYRRVAVHLMKLSHVVSSGLLTFLKSQRKIDVINSILGFSEYPLKN
jgi:hypothetical protein